VETFGAGAMGFYLHKGLFREYANVQAACDDLGESEHVCCVRVFMCAGACDICVCYGCTYLCSNFTAAV
jgi:hypothetical protein